jgi:exopolyphosphatase/guanosine-5'-triphosphate,3'-diphosphate pyrophosphatase
MRRVAVVDLGTNSTRLLVADVGPGVREVERLLEITRLGDGVDARGSLNAEAIARVLDTVGRYADRADALGAGSRIAVATSAVRDAANRELLLEPIERLGFSTRVLTGTHEAELTFAGVASDISTDGDVAVIDVGGGSTEVVLATDGDVRFAQSYAAGCVRMAERHGEELARCRADVHTIFAGLAPTVSTLGVAVAGTATTAAAIDIGCDAYDAEQIHGHRLSRQTIADQLRMLAPLDVEARKLVPGLEPDRAPVICAGLTVLGAVLDRLDLEEIIVSERDILHGVALQAL